MTETASTAKPNKTRRKPEPNLPSDQCRFIFSWAQFGLYLGCTGETVRARYRRGDFGALQVYRPTGWNGILVIKAEIDLALSEIVGRSQRRTCGKKADGLEGYAGSLPKV